MATGVSVPQTNSSGTAQRISWVHPPGGFLGLSLLNGVLRVLTLGVYHFWGKTEVRQRIWSAVRINGEPLEYRGTGGELCIGFLIVFALVLTPILLAGFGMLLFVRSESIGQIFNSGFWLLVFVLSGFGIYRARRYRLSRTRWRGIRAGLSGTSWRFAWTYLWTALLIPFTLGWIVPWRTVRLQHLLFNNTHFGDKPFTFTGRAGPLYKRYWLVWVSAGLLFFLASAAIGAVVAAKLPSGGTPVPIPSLTMLSGGQVAAIAAIILSALLVFAMVRAWYSAGVLNYLATQTTLEGSSFALSARAPSLVWLTATNYLLRVLSLGFLSPIAEARSTRYIVERLSLTDGIDFDHIGQNPDALLAHGEGLAEAFDVDAF
jgi:uncharacterized membrane protein YjgN (DUF898 family)